MGLYKDLENFKRYNYENVNNDVIDFDDNKWILNSFMVKSTDLDSPDNVNRFWSIVENKFTNTGLGGNISLNSYPQFTRYCDTRVAGRRHDRGEVSVNNLNNNIGMGRYYGEAIDDNSVNVYMTFGVAKFNNILNFFNTAISYRQSVIANSGRSPVAYDTAWIVGTAILFIAFPILTVLYYITSTVLAFIIGPGNNSYYYMQPNMVQYWSGVNSIVTMMATEIGIVPPMIMKNSAIANATGSPLSPDQEGLSFVRQYIPDIVNEQNYIDVMAIATKAQRAANTQFMNEMDLYEKGELSNKDFTGLVKKDGMDTVELPQSSFSAWVNKLTMASELFAKEEKPVVTGDAVDPNVKTNKENSSNDDGTLNKTPRKEDSPSYIKQAVAVMDSTLRDGALYAVFRVDNPGSTTETFRNDSGEIGLEGMIKGIGGKARSIEFSVGGGNILPGLDTVLNGVKDVAHGLANSLSLGVSNALTLIEGGGNISFPKRWTDSSAMFPAQTFRMKLTSPYGHPLAKLQNIYIPLACILQAALPRSTGINSYTSPFLLSMFIRGRQNITLGMITSLTVTRGTSNLPFDKKGKPMAIDVTFTVTDFNKILASPTPQSLFDATNIMYDTEAPLNKYIGALCGRSLYTTMNRWPKLKLRAARLINNFEFTFSPSNIGMRAGEAMPEVLRAFVSAKGTNYTEE